MTATRPRSVRTDGNSDLGYRIVQEVARVDGTDPIDLDAPLFDVVNVDALAALTRSADADVTASFEYLDYLVTVAGDGTVTVRDADAADPPSTGE